MTANILGIHHVQVTVPAGRMADSLRFYGQTLGLEEIAQPARDQPEPGAWYRVGGAELHLRAEAGGATDTGPSRRHVAFAVADIERIRQALTAAGAEFLPDTGPAPGLRRLFVRDPGGNRVELIERS